MEHIIRKGIKYPMKCVLLIDLCILTEFIYSINKNESQIDRAKWDNSFFMCFLLSE